MVVANEYEVTAFKQELDTYDLATMHALLEKSKILEQLYRQRDRLLDNAYRLDDGTRVFKSEDGVTVINEAGEEIPADVVTPEEIGDHHTKAEEYLSVNEKIDEHQAVDQRLRDYQEQLDAARELVNSGEMTKEELEDYRRQLQADMPLEVRQQLPDNLKPKAVSLKNEFDIPAGQVPTIGTTYSQLPNFPLN